MVVDFEVELVFGTFERVLPVLMDFTTEPETISDQVITGYKTGRQSIFVLWSVGTPSQGMDKRSKIKVRS